MTFDDYAKLIDGAIADADKAPDLLGQLKESLQTDLTSLETLKADNAQNVEKINELRETNIKLFLSQGGNGDKDADDETEPTAAEQLDKWAGTLYKIEED